METIFENQYAHNKQFFNEFFGYHYFRKPARIASNMLFAIAFVLGLLYFFHPGFAIKHNQTAMMFISIPAVFWSALAAKLFRYRQLGKRQELEINAGKKLDAKMHVYNNYIVVISPAGIQNTIPFYHVKTVAKTKNLYILHTQSKLEVIFERNSFTKGTVEDFVVFLRHKGYKVKL